jgi:hypothetical protein
MSPYALACTLTGVMRMQPWLPVIKGTNDSIFVSGSTILMPAAWAMCSCDILLLEKSFKGCTKPEVAPNSLLLIHFAQKD